MNIINAPAGTQTDLLAFAGPGTRSVTVRIQNHCASDLEVRWGAGANHIMVRPGSSCAVILTTGRLEVQCANHPLVASWTVD